MSEQAGRYQRSFSGLIGAVVILLVVIGAFVALRSLSRDNPDKPQAVTDWRQTVGFARQGADFALLAPPSLPAGWSVNAARFTPTAGAQAWHLGVVTAGGGYLGLDQATTPVADLVSQLVDGTAHRDGTVQVAGRSWTMYASSSDRALARRADGTTTLVVGIQVSASTLTSYVASLR